MAKINNLKDLVKELERGPVYDTYGSILKDIDIDIKECEPYCTWNDDRHTRNRIFRNGGFELMMTCIKPGQKTAIHNYGHQQGWAYILQGVLTEIKYSGGESTGDVAEVFRNKLKKGEMTYINDYEGMHQFINEGEEPVIALHLFVEPFEYWKAFNTDTGAFEDVKSVYDSDHTAEFES